MTIANETQRLKQAKADLKTAINNKGGTLTTETLDAYAAHLNLLASSSFASGTTSVASGKITFSLSFTPKIITISVSPSFGGGGYSVADGKGGYLMSTASGTITYTNTGGTITLTLDNSTAIYGMPVNWYAA